MRAQPVAGSWRCRVGRKCETASFTVEGGQPEMLQRVREHGSPLNEVIQVRFYVRRLASSPLSIM